MVRYGVAGRILDRNCKTHALFCAPNKRLCIVISLLIYSQTSDKKRIKSQNSESFPNCQYGGIKVVRLKDNPPNINVAPQPNCISTSNLCRPQPSDHGTDRTDRSTHNRTGCAVFEDEQLLRDPQSFDSRGRTCFRRGAELGRRHQQLDHPGPAGGEEGL